VRMSLVLCAGYAFIQFTGLQHGYWILLTSLFVCQVRTISSSCPSTDGTSRRTGRPIATPTRVPMIRNARGYAFIQFTGLQHGYWILLTSLFVCQPNYNATRHRHVTEGKEQHAGENDQQQLSFNRRYQQEDRQADRWCFAPATLLSSLPGFSTATGSC
jgi:hypothetical protein